MAFPTSPSNNDVHKEGTRSFVWDSTLGVWDQVQEQDEKEISGPQSIQSGEIGSAVTGFTGIKEMDWWQLTVSVSGNINPIVKNLERCLAGGFKPLGVGMTETHGVFTFPSTGLWEIRYLWRGWTGTSPTRYGRATIQWTSNNGSNWYGLADSTGGQTEGTDNAEFSNNSTGYFRVTATATHKVRFYTNYENQSTVAYGTSSTSTGAPGTSMHFKRLGDV